MNKLSLVQQSDFLSLLNGYGEILVILLLFPIYGEGQVQGVPIFDA